MLTAPPVCCSEVYKMIPDSWFKYEARRLLHIRTPPISTYRSWLYTDADNGPALVIAVANEENLLMCLAGFFIAENAWQAEHFFRFSLFDKNDGVYIMTQLAALFKDTGKDRLVKIIVLCDRGFLRICCPFDKTYRSTGLITLVMSCRF